MSANGVSTRFNLKQLDPTGGRLILVKRTPGLTEEALQALADDITLRMGQSCVLISVTHLSDIKAMDEAEMEKQGWVRAKRLADEGKRLTIALAHVKLFWDEVDPLYPLLDMAACPHETGMGRALWALQEAVKILTPPTEEELAA